METGAGIAGYTFGAADLEPSPVSVADVRQLEATLLWTEEDDRHLRMAGEVLADQVDAVLDVWYGYVGAHPHLLHYFTGPDGQPVRDYLERVRARFAQWVRDVCDRPRDQAWLDYQHEIALRHTREKKTAPTTSTRFRRYRSAT